MRWPTLISGLAATILICAPEQRRAFCGGRSTCSVRGHQGTDRPVSIGRVGSTVIWRWKRSQAFFGKLRATLLDAQGREVGRGYAEMTGYASALRIRDFMGRLCPPAHG